MEDGKDIDPHGERDILVESNPEEVTGRSTE
jgi:hypothetical protein